jgi:hypothetical protein
MTTAMMVTAVTVAAAVVTAMMAASRNGLAIESGASLWLSDPCSD